MKIFKSVMIIALVFCIIFLTNISYASDDLDEIFDVMDDVGKYDSDDTTTGIGKVINNIISIIQYVGSGIAIIMVTILGIQYLIASPSEKADTKKRILPMLIGCVLLFGAVNLVAAVIDLAGVVK